ncbi:putative GntR-family regulatory protein [Sphaerisporangium siamense]|uniref:DNA-binding transcriptional MocR family regulator n=1 Tax=Sphaerisporangium siamense TaxID=795645 RepID=A0A7W7G9V6_9ACTN|nr:PLP-dependent aminotransferase family protein [Sphaerisporangium siamense]MBB4701035.1 DNA-binding transcriptional MocR family regulator [Sphaerisporangium siamense]GII85820.1 putative GntR-family regulatory protein [Sphaerisporangium siamense]
MDSAPRPRRPDAPELPEAEVIAAFGDWATGTGPLYRRLADGVRRAIEGGALPPGQRVPAERQLAASLHLSRTTVVAAYDVLREAGLIESRTGSGTRVAANVRTRRDVTDGRVPGGKASSIYQRLIDGPAQVISLTRSAEGAVPELAQALRELAAGDLSAAFDEPGYHPSGLPALREAVAAYLTGTGLPTTPGQVLVTTGSHQALVLVSELYLRQGSTALAESPGWACCLDVYRARGAHVVTVPIDDDGPDVTAMAAAFADRRPDLVYLMPTFHNPTGVLTSASRRRAIAELSARHEVPILEDNAYIAHTGQGDTPLLLAAYAPAGAEVLSAGSLAKVVWAGLRIGWVRGPLEIIERLARRKALADLGSPVIDQMLAARLLPRLAEIQAARNPVRDERLAYAEKLLRERLPSWSWRRPAGGSGLWIELPGADAAEFSHVALRHGVEVVPGAITDPTGRHDHYLRLPFTFREDVLDGLVERLAGAWAEFTRRGPTAWDGGGAGPAAGPR